MIFLLVPKLCTIATAKVLFLLTLPYAFWGGNVFY